MKKYILLKMGSNTESSDNRRDVNIRLNDLENPNDNENGLTSDESDRRHRPRDDIEDRT
jgi:hypothetical protein